MELQSEKITLVKILMTSEEAHALAMVLDTILHKGSKRAGFTNWPPPVLEKFFGCLDEHGL